MFRRKHVAVDPIEQPENVVPPVSTEVNVTSVVEEAPKEEQREVAIPEGKVLTHRRREILDVKEVEVNGHKFVELYLSDLTTEHITLSQWKKLLE